MGGRAWWLLLAALIACGGSPSTETTDADAAGGSGGSGGTGKSEGCPPGERDLGGACTPAGDGAGVTACAEGFVADGDGCAAVLPEMACPPGSMAVPGEADCRPVASCGAGPWGDLPDEAGAQWVDASFVGVSDGTQSAPFTTIGEAVAAAAPGALVGVASGFYAEDVALVGKAIRLRGRCPSEVTLMGVQEQAALHIEDADGSEIGGIAITGPGAGVAVIASTAALDRVWIHDTTIYGAVVEAGAELAIEGSLIEAAGIIGAIAYGGAISVDRSVVRAPSPDADGGNGWCLAAQDERSRGRIEVTASLLELCTGAAVRGVGADLVVDESVVRDTLPAGDGTLTFALAALRRPVSGERGHLTLRRSVVSNSVEMAVTALGADAVIEDTTIRDVAEAPAGPGRGWGIAFHEDEGSGVRAGGSVHACVVSGSHEIGIFDVGSEIIIEDTVIRDVKVGGVSQDSQAISLAASLAGPGRAVATIEGCLIEGAASGIFADGAQVTIEGTLIRDLAGRCVGLQEDAMTHERASGTIRESAFERCHEIGLFLAGADGVVESTRIESTFPDVDGEAGQGILAQFSPFDETSSITLRKSLLRDNRTSGLAAIGATALIEDSVIEATGADVQQTFGDGVVASSYPALLASAVVRRTRIADNARAGVAAFGATIELSETTLECNAIQINGEVTSAPFAIEDQGGNHCLCGEDQACHVLSAGLEPPAAQP